VDLTKKPVATRFLYGTFHRFYSAGGCGKASESMSLANKSINVREAFNKPEARGGDLSGVWTPDVYFAQAYLNLLKANQLLFD